MAKIDTCNRCNAWTKNPSHGQFKCYCGDCPAKLRDDKKSKIELLKKQIIHRDIKQMMDDY